MAKLTPEEIQEQKDAIESVCSEIGGDLRTGYSGRGMYGATCWGIVCEDSRECIEEAALAGVRGAQVDSMGLKSIVYWRHISDDPLPEVAP